MQPVSRRPSALLRPAAAAPAADSDEKAGVARIRLRQPDCGATAMFSSFLEADRKLAAWKTSADAPVQCEFSLLFTDGESISGHYLLWRETHGRPALDVFIKNCLQRQGMKRVKPQASAQIRDQYGNVVDDALLARYDFARA